ncbi:MAG: hypothetical protein ABSH08_21445, partial [Tepidisphaeraceae bacterium]
MSSWREVKDELCGSTSPETVLARAVLGNMGISEDSDDYDELRESIEGLLKERCGKPLFPSAGDSLAISVMRPKIAALAFDKVYRLPIVGKDPVPEELAFYGGTSAEMFFYGAILSMKALESLGVLPPGFSSKLATENL